MPFTVRDFQSLIRALEKRAEWKAELRRLLLTEELLALPQTVRELSLEVGRLTEQVRELAGRHARLADSHAELTREVRELAASHARLAESHAQLASEVRALAASHAQLTHEVRELAASHARLAESHAQLASEVRALAASHAQLVEGVRALAQEVRALTAAQRRAEDRLGRLEGSDLERRYRERAAGLFQQLLTRVRVVDHQDLGLLLDDALEAGTLTAQDKAEILRADVVVRGRREQREVYALAEVSAVIGPEDVSRAATRARLLERVVGVPLLAVVAGRHATPEAARAAEAAGVWSVLDGRAEGAETAES